MSGNLVANVLTLVIAYYVGRRFVERRLKDALVARLDQPNGPGRIYDSVGPGQSRVVKLYNASAEPFLDVQVEIFPHGMNKGGHILAILPRLDPGEAFTSEVLETPSDKFGEVAVLFRTMHGRNFSKRRLMNKPWWRRFKVVALGVEWR